MSYPEHVTQNMSNSGCRSDHGIWGKLTFRRTQSGLYFSTISICLQIPSESILGSVLYFGTSEMLDFASKGKYWEACCFLEGQDKVHSEC